MDNEHEEHHEHEEHEEHEEHHDEDSHDDAPEPKFLVVREDNWLKSYWRPAMAWLYMAICAFDFIIFPILTMIIPVFLKSAPYIAWKPITLDNGGMVHLAFGAILGVSAWARSVYEKKLNRD